MTDFWETFDAAEAARQPDIDRELAAAEAQRVRELASQGHVSKGTFESVYTTRLAALAHHERRSIARIQINDARKRAEEQAKAPPSIMIAGVTSEGEAAAIVASRSETAEQHDARVARQLAALASLDEVGVR